MLPSTSAAVELKKPPLSRSAKKAKLKEKQTKAFEEMDKMMEDILETDLPGMCPFNFKPPQKSKPPVSSQSDGHICSTSNM